MLCSLLSTPRLVAEEQAFSVSDASDVVVRPYRSKGWGNLLWKGGMIRTRGVDGQRTGSHYLNLAPGTSSLLRMDFVNGVTIGPEVTLGYVTENQSRWELSANVEYACSRHAWMGEGALHYIFPPAHDSWVELFGGRRTTDYDAEPLLSVSQQQVAAALFAWNGGKLYEAARIGLKGRKWLLRDWAVEAAVWSEARYEQVNHRRTSLFGKRPENNVPRCNSSLLDESANDGYYGGYYAGYGSGYAPGYVDFDTDFYDGFWQYSPLLHWTKDHLWCADLTIEYMPHRVLAIIDDMHSVARTSAPTVRLKLRSAWDNNLSLLGGSSAKYSSSLSAETSRLRYLSTDFSIGQTIVRDVHQVAYFASTGLFAISNNVGLQDCRHFDAAHFPWLDDMNRSLTWFALLTNYEFSTDGAWIEAHGEYMRRYLGGEIGQYVQLHGVSISDFAHIEASYGWQLAKSLRLGVSFGFDHSTADGFSCDGIGLNLIVVPD